LVLREELRDGLCEDLCEGFCVFWTNRTHKTRKETGMNLENVRDRIWYSVRNSVYFSMENSAGYSVDKSVRDPVRDSVDFGLAAPIRQERRQG
jgi:hypothetical protein